MRRKQFLCPSFSEKNQDLHAKFDHIKVLYELDLGKPMKMGYKISDKVLSPSTIEKTNSCCHESTINALKYYSNHGHEEFSGTAEVLQIFRTLFNTINVKSLYTDQRTRDESRSAVKKEDRSSLEYFRPFAEWLKKWELSEQSGLSRQTFNAAKQTSEVFVHLSNYLLDEKPLDYVLPGHIVSDPLERRFSWFRQSSGANYHVSVLQILQAEMTIRIRSLIESGFKMEEMKNIFQSAILGNEELQNGIVGASGLSI